MNPKYGTLPYLSQSGIEVPASTMNLRPLIVRQGNSSAHQESQSPELSSKGSKNVTCRERLSKDQTHMYPF